MIICLIQEDYDAAKPKRKMGKSLLSDAMLWLLMTSLIHARFYCESHRVTKHWFMDCFFGEIVLAGDDIALCKHHIHHSTEAMPRIIYVTGPVNALFWSTLWPTQT